MGALNPLFLLAGAAVAVPLFLHLFQRHQARRLSFPALRYLERTEREHARRIRFRQLLLLMVRVAVLLVVVGAGARLFVQGRGAAHPPTAVVLILDNSMSAGRVVGGERVLDRLEAVALATLELANPEDRFWVLRAGEPWAPVAPLTPGEAQDRVRDTEVSAARGDLTAALRRAAGLLAASPLPAREIHLISDLQRTAFDPSADAPAGDLPVTVWAGEDARAPNRGLGRVLVGGGLPPLQGERTQLTVETSPGAEGDSTELPVRVVMDGRVRGAATVPLGSAAAVPLPPVPGGWVTGWVETDPDDLRADDRHAFAFQARPAPVVAVAGDPGRFAADALAVLEQAGRLRAAAPGRADVLLAVEGAGLERRDVTAAVVVPPTDATLLPALNRRLTAAGIPWQYERFDGSGEAPLQGPRLPDALEGTSVSRRYRLAAAGTVVAPTTLARVGDAAWAVETIDASGRRVLLLGSALDDASSTLPTSAAMVRFVDWAASDWAGVGGGSAGRIAGEPLDAPRAATRVRLPSGQETDIDGTRMVRETGQAGFYTFLAGDTVVSVVAVNPDPAESDLAALAEAAVPRAVSRDIVPVRRADAWGRAVFRERQGPELWRPLVLLALALLVTESLLAAAGRTRRVRGTPPPVGAAPAAAPSSTPPAPVGHGAD